MNPRERIAHFERKGLLTFPEGTELERLRGEVAAEDAVRNAREEERRLALEKERKGKTPFILEYRRGNIYQKTEQMEIVRREIWAKSPVDAAEIACQKMIEEERSNPTGVEITDALSCRLDVFNGNQLGEHQPIWINPYGLAPSQIADGGPVGFAETALKTLTENNPSKSN